MTDKEKAVQEMDLMKKLNDAINQFANEQLQDWISEHGYEGDESCVKTILKHLEVQYTNFDWHYSPAFGKIWHTIKI